MLNSINFSLVGIIKIKIIRDIIIYKYLFFKNFSYLELIKLKKFP